MGGCLMWIQVVFWISILALVHSYVLYPALLKIWSKGKDFPVLTMSEESLPKVTILLAVYNEEKVLRQKLDSIFASNYPQEKLELLIGSDGSTDATNDIIQEYIDKGLPIIYRNFGGRTGKSGILNQIYPEATGEIFIPTDANIMFKEDMISQLVGHFSNEKIGLVSAHILNTGVRPDGISHQEKTYIQRENLIKYREGILWGNMMGAFGACYAVRAHLFQPIPANFLMEDFYVTMRVIEAQFLAICDLKAVAMEDVSNDWQEEYKRKVRISAGNYQNLGVFYPMLWPFWKPVGFSFISHKLIRWLGPFLLLIGLITAGILSGENLFYRLAFFLQLLGLITPLIDALFRRMNMHNFALRLVAYFYLMNVALLAGFWKYLKGIRTSAWNPTIRNLHENEG